MAGDLNEFRLDRTLDRPPMVIVDTTVWIDHISGTPVLKSLD